MVLLMSSIQCSWIRMDVVSIALTSAIISYWHCDTDGDGGGLYTLITWSLIIIVVISESFLKCSCDKEVNTANIHVHRFGDECIEEDTCGKFFWSTPTCELRALFRSPNANQQRSRAETRSTTSLSISVGSQSLSNQRRLRILDQQLQQISSLRRLYRLELRRRLRRILHRRVFLHCGTWEILISQRLFLARLREFRRLKRTSSPSRTTCVLCRNWQESRRRRLRIRKKMESPTSLLRMCLRIWSASVTSKTRTLARSERSSMFLSSRKPHPASALDRLSLVHLQWRGQTQALSSRRLHLVATGLISFS